MISAVHRQGRIPRRGELMPERNEQGIVEFSTGPRKQRYGGL